MSNTFVVTGVLTDGQNLRLDSPVPLHGRVHLRLEPETPPPEKCEGLRTCLQMVEALWEIQRQRGYFACSWEEIQVEMHVTRESWGD